MKKLLLIFILIFLMCPLYVMGATGEKHIIYSNGKSINGYIIEDEVYVRIEDMAYILKDTAISFDVNINGDVKNIRAGENYSGNYMGFAGKNNYKDLSAQFCGINYAGYSFNFNGYSINDSSFVKLYDLGKIAGFGYVWNKATGQLTLTKQYNGVVSLEDMGLGSVLKTDYFSAVTGFYYSYLVSDNMEAVARTTQLALNLAPHDYSINNHFFNDILPVSIVMSVEKCRDDFDPDKPMVALTFDDGPKGSNTERILNALDAVGGRATFFMVGTNVDKYPEVVKKMNAQGSEMANHTYSHPQLTKLALSDAMTQINRVQQSVYSLTGKYPRSGRPPYGSINSDIGSASGLNWYNWSIDTMDWKYKNADRIYNAVINNVEDGDVILMHDIHSTTVEAAERIIPKLYEMGYQLVTISELAEAKGKENVPGYINLD